MSLQALDEIEAFLDARTHGIGATDAAQILGVSPWGGPFDVYLSKVDPDPPTEPSLPMWLGIQLQSTVGALYTHETGIRLRAAKKQRVHPQYAWQRCHLDFVELGKPKHLVECKTTSIWDEWGKQGSLTVPVHYWIQVQHEMAVTGAELTTIATLFGLRDFRYYDIERDDNFIERMTAAEDEFWHLNVVPQAPPPIDGSGGARRYLRRQYPVDNGLVRPLTPEQESVAEQYRIAKHNLEAVEYAEAEAKNLFIDLIGSDAGVKGSDFEVTYRKPKDTVRIDHKLVADFAFRLLEEVEPRALEEPFRRAGFAQMTLDGVRKGIEGIYTKTSEGSRRFLWHDNRSEVEP